MATKSTMIDFRYPRTNQALEVIPTTSIYRDVWKWNGIYHRKAVGRRLDSEKLDGTNEEFISILTYLSAYVPLLPKTFFDEVIPVDTDRIIKGTDLDYGEFLRLVVICMLITAKSRPELGRLF